MNILMKFESEEDRNRWMDWYIVVGEKLCGFLVNYDLDDGPPWMKDDETVEFKMSEGKPAW